MKKHIKIYLFVGFAFITFGCIKENKKSLPVSNLAAKQNALQNKLNGLIASLNSTKNTAAIDTMSKRYALLLDTNNMDPRKMDIMVRYINNYNKADTLLIAKQKDFIKSSGFPTIGGNIIHNKQNSINMNHVTSLTNLHISSINMTFEDANLKYKKFITTNSHHPYLNVFKQNTAALIIRKYLLDDVSKNPYLKNYTEELIHSNSQDYATIYLALNQIKNNVSATELSAYKQLIFNNKEALAFKHVCETYHQMYLEKARSATGNLSKLYSAQASLFEIPQARAEFFMNKIDKITNKTSL